MTHDLTLSRHIKVPRAKLWRCWTEPELLKQWFCPKPWGVSHAELEVRAANLSQRIRAFHASLPQKSD